MSRRRADSHSISETEALEGICKEFSDSTANLVMENRALKEKQARMEENLTWRVDEITELGRDADACAAA
jgi:hypothetical protein